MAGRLSPSHFTTHGFARLKERTALETIDVDGLISGGFAVNLGMEVGTKKVHWLLWSEENEECFVVIRDEANFTILTVLPLLFRENLAWPIKPNLLALAERVAKLRNKPTLDEANLPALKEHYGGFRLFCDAVFRTVQGNMIFGRKVDLRLDEILNFERLWEDPGFLGHFAKRLRKFRGEIVLEQLFVRLNNDGEAFKMFSPAVTILIA